MNGKEVKHTKRSARTTPQKLHIEKGARGLTTQAGLIPVAQFLRKHNVSSLIAKILDHERGASALYDAVDGICLTIVAIMGGARSMTGIVTVWSDRVLRRIAGWSSIPDDSSFGRLFKSFTMRHVSEIETVNHALRTRIWRYALRHGRDLIGVRRHLAIDVDSTVKTVYGQQEGTAKGYNPHKKGAFSYHPLLAFCTDTKEILQGWLRDGSAYTSNGIVEFTKQLLANLPKETRIFFRADSGFFVGDLLDLLDKSFHDYLIKVKLKNLTALLAEQHWVVTPGRPGWEQCEFWHQCGTWSKSRQFVAVRQEQAPEQTCQPTLFEVKKFDYFCYVVSKLDDCPWTTHKRYGKRATSETWIEEAKNQMALAAIKTNSFDANSALFQCAILAYNTQRWMALCSGDQLLRRWEPLTLRAFIIRVGGLLRTGSRQLTLQVPETMLYQKQWDAWLNVAAF
jgi:hypothetical protein